MTEIQQALNLIPIITEGDKIASQLSQIGLKIGKVNNQYFLIRKIDFPNPNTWKLDIEGQDITDAIFSNSIKGALAQSNPSVQFSTIQAFINQNCPSVKKVYSKDTVFELWLP